MKKTVLALVCVLMVSVFSGCGAKTLGSDQLLSVINSSGKIISIGDTEAQVTAITGADEANIMEFEEDNVRRVDYWDSPGIVIDYLGDKVVAIRLSGEGKWFYIDGMKIGVTKEKSEEYFSRTAFPMRETGVSGGVFLAYDEALNPVTYDENAPYTVRVSYKPQKDNNGVAIENGPLVVDMIAIGTRLPTKPV